MTHKKTFNRNRAALRATITTPATFGGMEGIKDSSKEAQKETLPGSGDEPERPHNYHQLNAVERKFKNLNTLRRRANRQQATVASAFLGLRDESDPMFIGPRRRKDGNPMATTPKSDARKAEDFWAAVERSARLVQGAPKWTQAGLVLSGNYNGSDYDSEPLEDAQSETAPSK